MERARDLAEEALSTLEEAVERLDACGPDALSGAEQLLRFHRLAARVDYHLTAAVGAFDASGAFHDDGARSAAGWLERRCKLPEGTARREVRLGRALPQLRLAAAAWRSGDIASAQLNELARLSTGRGAPALFGAEELLVGKARELGFEDFQRACRYFEQLADPDGSDEADERRRERRQLSLSSSIGGLWFGRIVLDQIGGEIVAGELGRIERELFDADWSHAKGRLGREPRAGDLGRSSLQRRADALVEMATRSASTPEGAARPAPLFSALVDFPTLSGRICELASGQVVSPGSLVPYLDRAVVERAVFGPAGRIEIGTRRRFFDGAARRAIELRDRRCSHPMCSEPASACQVDHIVPYDEGGLTVQSNGRLLCPYHNRLAWRDWLALDPEERARVVAEHLARFKATAGAGATAQAQPGSEDESADVSREQHDEATPRRGPPG